MVSANLAVSLAARRKQVVLFDADLGLANAQLALGQRSPFNFSHVLSGSKSLKDVTIQINDYLRFVPGASGMQEMASLDKNTLANVIASFSELSQDLRLFHYRRCSRNIRFCNDFFNSLSGKIYRSK